jgi:PKD repeat protein
MFLLSTASASIGIGAGFGIGAMVGPTPLTPVAAGLSVGKLAASASASPLSGPAPLTVTFKGAASGGSPPYSYSWNFGGPLTSTLQNPTHLFSYTGAYSVTLTVTDSKKATARASISIAAGAHVAGTASSLVAGGTIATTPSSFFSLNTVTNCAKCIASSSAINSYLNSTPFHWVRYGVDTDSCNESADLEYSSSGVASSGCGFDITSLKTWCTAQTPQCQAILTLPGENNNSAEDAAIAKYVVKTLGFQPAYWSIGNEPTGWTHYGIAWTKWKTTDSSAATPVAYAVDVRNAITAVTAVDSSAKFIGLEAACSCNTLWFQDVAKIDGSKIAAIAYHSYPSDGSTSETASQLYALLPGSKNLTESYATIRSDITGSCTTCASLPIFVNEYNAGPGWAPSTVSGTYANAVFLAASVTQALRANVTQLSIYSLQTTSTSSFGYALMNAANTIGPTGTLFSGLLKHLTLGQVQSTSVKTSVGDVWCVATKSGVTQSLLVVNANMTTAVALTLGSAFSQSTSGTIYQWNANLTAPLSTTGLPASAYSIPPQGILLITI